MGREESYRQELGLEELVGEDYQRKKRHVVPQIDMAEEAESELPLGIAQSFDPDPEAIIQNIQSSQNEVRNSGRPLIDEEESLSERSISKEQSKKSSKGNDTSSGLVYDETDPDMSEKIKAFVEPVITNRPLPILNPKKDQ